jgi:putative ABC transport system permease protein
MNARTIIWRNFRGHVGRTVFTILAVASAFAVFTLLGAIRVGVNGTISAAGAQRLVTAGRVASAHLPVSYGQKIARTHGVQAVTFYSGFGGYYREPKNHFDVLAFDAGSVLDVFPEFHLAPGEKTRFETDRMGAIAGDVLAERMGWHVGQFIPVSNGPLQQNGSKTWLFRLDGIYRSELPVGYRQFFVVSYEYLNKGIADAQSRDTVQQFESLVSDPRTIDATARAIDANFATSSPSTSTRSEIGQILSALRQFGDISMVVLYTGLAVFFTMLIITGSAMVISVQERLADFAVLRAVGFTRAAVIALVLEEAALLIGTGALLGIALGWGLCIYLAPLVTAVLRSFGVTPWSLAATAVLAAFVTLLIGVVPGLRGARTTIATALRGA